MARQTRLKIVESVGEIASRINVVIANKVDKAIKSSLPYIESDMQDILKGLWFNTATYNSLLYGELNGRFGFYKPTAKSKVNAILEKAAESVEVNFRGTRIFKTTFRSTIDIYILNNNLTDILKMSAAFIETEEYTLPWLDWLLTQGDKIIINEYRFFPKNAGRSGKGIMVRGGNFRVPSEHSGIIGDNWLTRTIEQLVTEIATAFKKSVEMNVGRFIQ
jgi:hypothetical protein